ncbi:DUF3857 domain-containing protein [Sphingosinicella sp. CPCC 101087]|uniref:DUF3857 domain-containing protein n=1 Tax=Sphingosinicella sp. CPCC 101087 TaxID=2497754 RepID=UPI001FB066D7|nr:DUF3857 domain-containing protein [Sphingosinicella sp. CPCC 101087]
MAFWALLLAAAPAPAAREPTIAPIPEWVERLDIPEADPALRDRHVQNLLITAQSLYGPEQVDHFMEMATLVQTMPGLQGVGNIVLPWQPDHSELIIHKVQIRRGATVIDLLAQGHQFTVLRRENNLEAAMLDGTLTAVMQAEGLEIGDTLNLAFTVRRRAGTLGLGGENFFLLRHGNPIGRYHIRQIWPRTLPIQWRGRERLARPEVRRTARGTELVVDLRNAEGPEVPDQAPARYALAANLQVTAFRDWAELSALIAPHYDRASELAPDSALRREIDRIAAAHADPRSRAMAALRLVQDDVRYFALLMGNGNYLPATADETWTRRYGDCKAKTVTLVALLRGLGLEAEPVLVNVAIGDTLDQLLPQMGAFNHVIVRTRIDGRSYWLDGTHVGDRDLESLASSPLAWGLPVRAGGAELEAIPFSPPSRPMLSTRITYDGSNGLAEPVSFRREMMMRGDSALSMRMAMSQVGRDEFTRRIRESSIDINGSDEEVTSVDIRDDPDEGTFTLIHSGTVRLEWTRNTGTLSYRFRFDNDTIDWDQDFERQEGPHADVPFALDAQSFIETVETVLLPNRGRGFTLDGGDFDRTVAGVRFSRSLSLVDGRAIARSLFQPIARELAAAEAKAGLPALREIADDEAYLVAPLGAVSDASQGPVGQDGSASALISSGYVKLNSERPRAALEDFDRVIALAPDWATAHANRAIALIDLQRLDEARAALAQAMRRDPEDFVVHQGYGLLHLNQERPEDAISALTRSLELDPDNSTTLGLRSWAYQMVDREDEALADADRVVAVEPGNAFGHIQRAALLVSLESFDEAAAAMDAAQAADPTNFFIAAQRGDLLARLQRPAEALDAYRNALQLYEAAVARGVERTLAPEDTPTDQLRMRLLVKSGRYDEALAQIEARLRRYPGNYRAQLARCWLLAEADTNLERALSDCNAAREADPEHDEAMIARGLVYLRLQRWSDAAREFDRALGIVPVNSFALYGRAVARIRGSEAAAGGRDLARARRLNSAIEWEFERYGLAPVSPAGAGS